MGVRGRILRKTWNLRRRMYLWSKRRKLKNQDFTIISSNCIGGVMYHDLNLKFNSPTINLWFKPEDFFCFLNHLDYFLDCEIEEGSEEGINYPVGRMKKGDSEVTIYFMHYKTFSEAVDKWKERAKRVNMTNIFVVFEYPAIDDSPERQSWIRTAFDSIPFQHKVMLTKKGGVEGENIKQLGFYDNSYYSGRFADRKDEITVKRYLDEFDYVSFLNG